VDEPIFRQFNIDNLLAKRVAARMEQEEPRINSLMTDNFRQLPAAANPRMEIPLPILALLRTLNDEPK
jgi:hypothetical protein